MIEFTEDNPEGMEHGPWERERLRLLSARGLNINGAATLARHAIAQAHSKTGRTAWWA